jgi:CO/xanthine dehydrogenase Mo-binding subunit
MSDFGKSVNRIDALAKVTGKALYPGDYYFKDQLHMKVLFSRIPHAIIKSINTKKAEQTPGVVAVLTAKDVPNNVYGLIVPDQPVLCGPGSNRLYADRVRFIGDQIALIIAETEEIAIKARSLIEIEFEELEIVSDAAVAIKEDSVLVHPDKGSNVFCHYRIRKGDTQAAFAKADIIVESTYKTPVQEHAYLQPEAGVSYYDEEGRITIVVAGQCAHEDQHQIAHALNIDVDSVRVIYPAIGGAFGGREDTSIQIILALAVFRLKEKGITRPVKLVWTREESIIGHHKRHPYTIRAKWGATKEGKITAAEVDLLSDGGAYIYTSTKVLGNATLLCTGPYNIPNVKVDSYVTYTNNIPNGAFRGFGGPQAAFSAELQMDKIAEILNLDPVEIRMRNLIKEGDLLSVGTPLPKGITIEKAIAACVESAGWKSESGKGFYFPKRTKKIQGNLVTGTGFACGYKNIGFSNGAPEYCWAIIELHGKSSIEKVILRHAGAEVGQGSHTAFIQMTSKALNIPMEQITLVASDTATSNYAGSVSASRMTFMAGNAIKGAAELALEKWRNEERPAIAEFKYSPPKTTPFDPETGKCEPNFAYGYVAEAVDCVVDMETGEIKITNVICADDVGKAVNPRMVESQVEGAIVQAAGYVLQEEFIQRNGLVFTDKLSTYLIPTSLDTPDNVESIVLEYSDIEGPWGVRGVGEMPFLPFAAAVASAVHSATGIWFDEFPLTAERVLSRIHQRNMKQEI